MNSDLWIVKFAIAAIICVIIISGAHASPIPEKNLVWVDSSGAIQVSDIDGGNLTEIYRARPNLGNIHVDEVNQQAYWSNGFTVQGLDLSTFQQSSLLTYPPPRAFRGDVDIDLSRNLLFFVDGRNNIIYKAGLDGSDLSVVIPASGMPNNIEGFSELVLDQKNETVYWSDNGLLRRSNYDGTGVSTLFDTGGKIGDFELDIEGGQVYWSSFSRSDRNGGDGAIHSANLDGSQRQTLIDDLWWANGLAVDIESQRLYYTDSALVCCSIPYTSIIGAADLNGANQSTIVELGSTLQRPFEIDLVTFPVPEPNATVMLSLALVCFFAKQRDALRT